MMPAPSPSSFPSPPPTSATTDDNNNNEDVNTWGPYAGGRDFKGNALLILSAVFCAVVLFLALGSIVRFLFCGSCDGRDSSSGSNGDEDPAREEKSSNSGGSRDHVAIDVASFSKGMGLAGSGAECAICLSEFQEGEGIRVLPACRHGFHVRCVERWLEVRRSCPTCRMSAAAAASSSSVAVKVSSDQSDDRNIV